MGKRVEVTYLPHSCYAVECKSGVRRDAVCINHVCIYRKAGRQAGRHSVVIHLLQPRRRQLALALREYCHCAQKPRIIGDVNTAILIMAMHFRCRCLSFFYFVFFPAFLSFFLFPSSFAFSTFMPSVAPNILLCFSFHSTVLLHLIFYRFILTLYFQVFLHFINLSL